VVVGSMCGVEPVTLAEPFTLDTSLETSVR
jgi:hypothetical protein